MHTYGSFSSLYPNRWSQSNLPNETSGILPACGCEAHKQLGLHTHIEIFSLCVNMCIYLENANMESFQEGAVV